MRRIKMDNEDIELLIQDLTEGSFSSGDIKDACLALRELLDLRDFRENAFKAYPNLDLDIELLTDA